MDELLDMFLPDIIPQDFPRSLPCLPSHPQHSLMARMDLHPCPCSVAPTGTTIPMKTTNPMNQTAMLSLRSISWVLCLPAPNPWHPTAVPHLPGTATLQSLQKDKATVPVPFPAAVRTLLLRGHHLQGRSIHGPRGVGPQLGGSCLTSRGGFGGCCPFLRLLWFSWPGPTP